MDLVDENEAWEQGYAAATGALEPEIVRLRAIEQRAREVATYDSDWNSSSRVAATYILGDRSDA